MITSYKNYFLFHSLLICFILIVCINSDKKVIWNERPTIEQLRQYALAYNKWADSVIKDNIFELKANEEYNLIDTPNNNSIINKNFVNYFNDGSQFKVFTKKDLISNKSNKLELYSLNSKHFITVDKVYEHKVLGEFVQELEKKYGYDEIAYIAMLLIYEYYNPDSVYRHVLDILPKVPNTPAMLYWNNTNRIENELLGYSALRKVVDYKINVDNKVRSLVNGVFKNNENIFDPDIFNEENTTWAIYNIESLLHRIYHRSFFNPYIPFMRLTADEKYGIIKYSDKTVKGDAPFYYYLISTIQGSNIKANEEVYRNQLTSGDYLLVYFGLAIDNNQERDCLSLGLTFSERKDDKLSYKRQSFFSKFHLFDRNHHDLIEECVVLKKALSYNRLLFYFYTLMMDANDLEKSDPKRDKLEEDRLIIKFARDELIGMQKLKNISIEKEKERLLNEQDFFVKQLIKYKIQQYYLMEEFIKILDNQYYFLVKDEVL